MASGGVLPLVSCIGWRGLGGPVVGGYWGWCAHGRGGWALIGRRVSLLGLLWGPDGLGARTGSGFRVGWGESDFYFSKIFC